MYRVCIDTGGTFTDCVVMDEAGALHQFKAPTTPWDFSEGVLNVIGDAAGRFELDTKAFLTQTEYLVHGTTVSTNALVQRKLAKAALITSEGFRDIIEMRRSLKIDTMSMYDAYIPPYTPIIPRRLRYTVGEKTAASGEILVPVGEDALAQVIAKIKEEQVEAIAICFINSYANSENELKAFEICSKALADVFISCSSLLLPKMGEYERESTCVINASVGPIVKEYLRGLEEKLQAAGFANQLLIVQANQYVQSVGAVVAKPVYLTGSGPAAGPAGAAHLGASIGEGNFLIGDLGGTTWDVSLIRDGKVSLKVGDWLGDDRIGIKVADVTSVGAGGGSIAWLNTLGLLQVGPQSASSDPGPACYGHGGVEPTVTDAAVVLGYIDPANFNGGKLALRTDLAREAISKIATGLNMSVEEAAQAIFNTVNSNMADAISEISTYQGHDVRDFSLLAIGGGGPMCGAFVGDLLGMKKTIVPRYSSSFCAWSMFFLDIGRDYVRSHLRRSDLADLDVINALFDDMAAEALCDVEVFGVSADDLTLQRSVEMRYQGQYHVLELELPIGRIEMDDIRKLEESFHLLHKELFTFSLSWVPIELINMRLTATLPSTKVAIEKTPAGDPDASKAIMSRRDCWFAGAYVATPIYDGAGLRAGHVISGNAIIEEPTATTVIPAGLTCMVDEVGNYVITSGHQA